MLLFRADGLAMDPSYIVGVVDNRYVQLSAGLDPLFETGSSLSRSSLAGLLFASFA